MDGIHDLGGKPGYGRVKYNPSEPYVAFSERWHAKVFAIVNAAAAAGAYLSVDRFRHAVERVRPGTYLAHGYYGRWLGGIENLLVEAGIVNQHDISDRALGLGASADDPVAAQPMDIPDPPGQMPQEPGAKRSVERPPRYRVGDRVTTTSEPVPVHTRLPAYARGKTGEIISHHDGWIFPDTSAHGAGESPQHLYTVKFDSDTLWGTEGFSVTLDLFEPYLLEAEHE